MGNEKNKNRSEKIDYIFPTFKIGRTSWKGTKMVRFLENEWGLHWKEAPISHIKKMIKEVRDNTVPKQKNSIKTRILLPNGEEIIGYATFRF